ncbi:DegT/DnrJ/EryC1/StrS family aminotransferase [Cochlodiniinecator piscidefendens]|uniref:DegT/DnrJ/EryC1/StrS family aminotransferase n=1 Tax=Cochlodiniinecator piscidefendens TaxID=2715756 RepID=UPI00140E5B37|nr:DegT/DnrJ/EryC1/StrS family aminotransferase [Cochlodiniinecator piscidefendens]
MIPFIDLATQQHRIRSKILKRFEAILDHGQYIMGPEIVELEQGLQDFCGAKHAISCSNGTDALLLAVMALGASEGDAILCPSFTFAATAEIIPCVGATPIFVDIDPVTFNMDVDSLKSGIVLAQEKGLNLKGVIAVDLFGLAADYDPIIATAREHGMWVISDSAQGFGAIYKGKRTGSIGDIATTSFFPAKPLGGYGDGGAVFTNDDELANILKSLRVHGQGTDKYDNVRIGMNGRLDTLQAAVLIEKLALYPEEIDLRQKVADRYAAGLNGVVETPVVPEGYGSVWAQYTVKLPEGTDRTAVQAALKEANVPSAVYYPIPLHQQTAYKHWPSATASLANTEALAPRVLSLPMHPYLSEDDQNQVIAALKRVLAPVPA